jgi:RNA polymerase sigma-70 factor (ECF subfamily)
VEYHVTRANLSELSTQWNLVFEARYGTPEQVNLALSKLMCRYAGAVHRYLLKATSDPDVAEELSQEFAVRFLRGDFRHGDPNRGRFRDYVKRAVQNLMKDYYRKRPRNRGRSLEPGVSEPSSPDEDPVQFDRQFLLSWRSDQLDRAWIALDKLERRSGQPHYTILRLRVDEPGLNSKAWAARLSEKLGRPVTPGAFRQALQRARREFARQLIADVRDSLGEPTLKALEEELADLELLDYCRPFVGGWKSLKTLDVSTVDEAGTIPGVEMMPQIGPAKETSIRSESAGGIDRTTVPEHPEAVPVQPTTIRRHTDVSFPALVPAGKVYNLRIQLVPAVEVLPSGQVRDRPKPHPHDATLNLPVPPASGPDQPAQPVRLTISLAVENFVIQGPGRAEILVPQEGSSPPVQFGLRGLGVGPGRIMIDFAQDGRPAGSVDLAPVIVPDDAATSAGPEAALPPVELDLDLHTGPTPGIPDVVLKVYEHRLAGHPGRLQFVLSSSHPALSDLPVLDGDLGTLDLRTDVAGWIEEQLRAVGTLVAQPGTWPDDVDRTLAGVGFNLYEQLLPPGLQELSWTFRRRGVKTLMILSDEPHIPWELIKPFRADPGTGEIISQDGYWGESYALTHWLRGRPPVSRLSIARIVGVAASSSADWPAPVYPSEPVPSGVRDPTTRDMNAIHAAGAEIGSSGDSDGSGPCDPGPSRLAADHGMGPDITAIPPTDRPEASWGGSEGPTAWDEELELLQSLEALGARVERLPALRPVLRRAFEEGSFDLLHLVSHGTFGGIAAGDATALFLDDGVFTAAELSPLMAGALRRSAPLILFNTCHCGRSGFSLTRLGSWGAHLVRLGCGAFIGAQWPVSDRAALEFARVFYTHLAENRPLGEAVRRARLFVRWRYPGDPTWLAYRCFADPTARFDPGRTPGPS